MQLPNTLQTPSFFQKLHWVADPVGYMENAVQKYPDLFTTEIIGFGDTAVFVQHPKALQEILTNDRKKFTVCRFRKFSDTLYHYQPIVHHLFTPISKIHSYLPLPQISILKLFTITNANSLANCGD